MATQPFRQYWDSFQILFSRLPFSFPSFRGVMVGVARGAGVWFRPTTKKLVNECVVLFAVDVDVVGDVDVDTSYGKQKEPCLDKESGVWCNKLVRLKIQSASRLISSFFSHSRIARW